MRISRHLAVAAALLGLIAQPAIAQTQRAPTAISPGGQVVNTTPSAMIIAPGAGASGPGRVVATDVGLPVTCLSGCASPAAFTLGLSGSLAVTSATARVALPAGGTVILLNNGATDLFYQLGNSAVTATTSNYLLPAGKSLAIGPGAATHVAAITASGTSSLSITTGTGVTNFAGAGVSTGGGGGGGAVTMIAGAMVDGADVTQGALADAVWSGSGSGTQQAIAKYTGQKIEAVRAALAGGLSVSGSFVSLSAGSAIAGKFGIDQTTPGTTNGVVINSSALPTGASTAANQATAIASLGSIDTKSGETHATIGAAAPTKADYAGVVSGGNIVGLVQASASAAISVSTATTTQLVGLVGGQKIYVTSFDVIAAGGGNLTFVYGTGTNCGTGTTTLTGAYPLTAQAGIAKGNGLGPVLVVPAGNALCVTTSAAIQMSGSVAYTQF